MISDEFIEALGVDLARGNEREARGYCPVHHLVKGRESSSAKWYMNRITGAWFCFSCQQGGSLSRLTQLMNLDEDVLGNMPVTILRSRIETLATPKEEQQRKPEMYISQYAFSKNPLPPKSVREYRHLSKEMCERYDVRWSLEGRHYLIPICSFDGKLMGWQEKSVGYFMNVPDEVPKSQSLFGYQQLYGDTAILVESPLDVVRLASEGFSGGVATFGAYPSDEQLAALSAAVETVVLAFDNDTAGQKASARSAKELRLARRIVKVVAYPKLRHGKDPGEWPSDELERALNQATPFTGLGKLAHR